ncbi:MAG: hypothetical protein MUF72_09105 [Elainella sp. Prado103]|nr:hypothetical protein [Elainella sp. Prado103]
MQGAAIWSTHFFLSFGFSVASSLLFSEKVIAETRSTEAMGVRAEYSDRQAQFCLENPHLRIIRNGQIAFDADLKPEGACRQDPEVFVIEDLDGDREPEVLIDFYSGGAHCCSSSLIFRYNPAQAQYTATEHFWGHGHGARQREDLDGDGQLR